MKILAIESSCDETAAALVEDGVSVLSNIVATSKELHLGTGGIVPEIAARKQVEFIVPVIEESLREATCTPEDIDSLAVTVGPGLIGSLLVGVNAAKALALAWNKPLIPVNHLVGHIYANWVGQKNKITFPAIVLIVSGGHTDLVLMKDHGDFEYLGGTIDDAAGEAFDKTARLLGLAKYLGGKELSDLSATCLRNPNAGFLPRPLIDRDNFDFSFSGLKTAVKRKIESGVYTKDVLACEFEKAVVDVLVYKTVKAVKTYDVKTVLMGGGVTANSRLRSDMTFALENLGVSLHYPPLDLCTDNAVYIGAAAYFCGTPVDLAEIKANPSLGVVDSC